ncbi:MULTISPECIES: glycosyltransferase family 4 protein [Emticicia]|uniref:glycosyltransferase family 4 protein n=1 Tax=Emticicia TaxID=312278 RepID=UPI0007D8A067|nr:MULTISPECIES: glycosyltransferase [Emticicia]
MSKKLVLFITPTGGRTGSEMLLWYLLKHLSGKIKSAIYTRLNGELFATQSTADQTFINNNRRSFIYQIYEGIYHKIFKITPEEKKVLDIQKKIKADRWYLNTITMPQFARLAQKVGVPYDLHVHELVSIYDEIKFDDFKFQFDNAARIICCSSIVERRIREMGYSNTLLLHSFIDTQTISIKQSALSIRDKIGIPADAFVWVMSGSMNLRKGYDTICDLFQYLPQNTYIVWLGSVKQTGVLHYIRQRTKIEKLNFIEIGEKSAEYYDYLNISDGFVLTAKEDPFPLVMIEAAYLEKPIVGYNSGGIAEFIQNGMGLCVDSFNPKDLGEAMAQIQEKKLNIDNNTLRNRALDFDIQNQISKWDNLFDL